MIARWPGTQFAKPQRGTQSLRRATTRMHPQRVCGSCELMEARVTIRNPSSVSIGRPKKVVPNQRYNININSNSNSNSYLLLLSGDSDVYLTLMSPWEMRSTKTSFAHGVFEWKCLFSVVIFGFDKTLFY